MNREELLQSLLEEIVRVFKSMIVSLRFGKNKYKLSRSQIGILMLLAKKKEGVSVKDLAKELNVTSGAITQFTDGLVKKGLVNREEDPGDRRTLNLKLSKAAREKHKEFKKNYFKSLSPMFNSLNDEEIKQLSKLLSKIIIYSNQDGCKI